MKNALLKKNTGFTLIELLVVIAVLGILAAVVLVAINPVEQFRRARDSGRKSVVSQLGNAMESYYTARAGSTTATYLIPNALPPVNGWIDDLAAAGEVKASVIGGIPGNSDCVPNTGQFEDGPSNVGVCYGTASTNTKAYIWTVLESQSEDQKCAIATEIAMYYWGSDNGRACLVCGADQAIMDSASETCNITQ